MRSLLLAGALLVYPAGALAKTVVIDRCHVRLEADPQPDQQKLLASVRARLASATVTLDATGTLVEKLAFQPPYATAGTTDRAAIAARFVEGHRDLLNIDAADKLTFTEQAVRRRGETRHLLTARFQHRGIDRMLSFLVDDKGELTSVDNNGVTPDFPMCDTPTLRPGDPKIGARVVGQRGWRMTRDGKREPFRVTKAEAATAVLRRVVRREGAPPEWFRGYQVTVDELGTSYFVDGETGALVE